MISLKGLFSRIKEYLDGNQIIVLGIKYIPVICTALATVHLAFLLMHIYEPYSVSLAVVLMLILLILLSIRFNFCCLHKAMILYMVLMAICICIRKADGFGKLLTVFRLGMFAIGIGLLSLAIFKKCGDDCDKQ